MGHSTVHPCAVAVGIILQKVHGKANSFHAQSAIPSLCRLRRNSDFVLDRVRGSMEEESDGRHILIPLSVSVSTVARSIIHNMELMVVSFVHGLAAIITMRRMGAMFLLSVSNVAHGPLRRTIALNNADLVEREMFKKRSSSSVMDAKKRFCLLSHTNVGVLKSVGCQFIVCVRYALESLYVRCGAGKISAKNVLLCTNSRC